jgi:hypothetical protein
MGGEKRCVKKRNGKRKKRKKNGKRKNGKNLKKPQAFLDFSITKHFEQHLRFFSNRIFITY